MESPGGVNAGGAGAAASAAGGGAAAADAAAAAPVAADEVSFDDAVEAGITPADLDISDDDDDVEIGELSAVHLT